MRCALTGLAALLAGAGAAAAEPVIAWIDLEPQAGALTVVGHVHALEAAAGDAMLTIERRGEGGNLSTRQGGSFDLSAGGEATVARVGLNIAAGDRLTARIEATVDGRSVAIAEIRIGDEDNDAETR